MLGTVPAVTVIVQGLKTGLAVEGRWAFLLSLVCGLGVTAMLQGYRSSVDVDFAVNWFAVGIEGLIAGLSASGLYAGITTGAGAIGRPADPTDDVVRND